MHEVGRLLETLQLERYIEAFEEEELTELYLLSSMGESELRSNLAELGLADEPGQVPQLNAQFKTTPWCR